MAFPLCGIAHEFSESRPCQTFWSTWDTEHVPLLSHRDGLRHAVLHLVQFSLRMYNLHGYTEYELKYDISYVFSNTLSPLFHSYNQVWSTCRWELPCNDVVVCVSSAEALYLSSMDSYCTCEGALFLGQCCDFAHAIAVS